MACGISLAAVEIFGKRTYEVNDVLDFLSPSDLLKEHARLKAEYIGRHEQRKMIKDIEKRLRIIDVSHENILK